MAKTVRTYRPKDISFILGGYEVGGFESITATIVPEKFKIIKGIRGQHTRVKTFDQSGEIQIRLLQTSPMNDLLSDILNADIAQQAGRLAIQLKDRSGDSLIISDSAFIMGLPSDITYSDGLNSRVWTIRMLTCEAKVGGNSSSLPQKVLGAVGSLFS